MKAYKKGVFNFIKEDVDKYTNETIPRKYFSGGVVGSYKRAAEELGHETLVREKTISTHDDAMLIRGLESHGYDYAEIAAREKLEFLKEVGVSDRAMTTNGELLKIIYEKAGMGIIGLTLAVSMQGYELEDAFQNFDDELGIYVIPDEVMKALGPLGGMTDGQAFNLLGHIGLKASTVSLIKAGNQDALYELRHEQSHNKYREKHPDDFPYTSIEQTLVDEIYAHLDGFISTFGREKLFEKRAIRWGEKDWFENVVNILANDYVGKNVEHRELIVKKLSYAFSIIKLCFQNNQDVKIMAYIQQSKNLDDILGITPIEHQQWLVDAGVQPTNHPILREKWTQFVPNSGMIAESSKDNSMLVQQVSEKHGIAMEVIGFFNDWTLEDWVSDESRTDTLLNNLKNAPLIYRGERLDNILDAISSSNGYLATAENPDGSHLTTSLQTAQIFAKEESQFVLKFSAQRMTHRQEGMYIRSTRMYHAKDSVMGPAVDLRTLTDENKQQLWDMFEAKGMLNDKNREKAHKVLWASMDEDRPVDAWKKLEQLAQQFDTNDWYELWKIYHSSGLSVLIDKIGEIANKKLFSFSEVQGLRGTSVVPWLAGKLRNFDNEFENRDNQEKDAVKEQIYELSYQLVQALPNADILDLRSNGRGGDLKGRIAREGANYFRVNQIYFGIMKGKKGSGFGNMGILNTIPERQSLQDLTQIKDRLLKSLNPSEDNAMAVKGGIDLNSANLNLQIKRDGKGVPLPIDQQNLDNIHIDGLIPVLLGIKPVTETPLLSELQSSQVPQLASVS